MEQRNLKNIRIILCLTAIAVTVAIVFCTFFFKKTPVPEFTVERWTVNEMIFNSTVDYERPFYDVTLSVVFRNTKTGKILDVPCFWDGGSVWRARYALPEDGIWTYRTECSDRRNVGLRSYGGAVACQAYTGDLAIYRHGFIKTEPGTRYFIYDDGTPFFYLGDNHCHMVMEDFDDRFRTTVDARAEQGFTVIQSQPFGPWTAKGKDSYFTGIYEEFSEALLSQFQLYDKYFAYIAEKGLVHANAQFSDAEYLEEYEKSLSEEDLVRLCRYWIARYGAYPTVWTMARENGGTACEDEIPASASPWKKVAAYLFENDPYRHPLTMQQSQTHDTQLSETSFREVKGHSWYAVRHIWNLKNTVPNDVFRSYWENRQQKISVLYESKYDHFRTGTTGARAQGWVAYLSGMYGYGYGSQKIWSANEAPGIWAGDIQSTFYDGYDALTWEEMDLSWEESLRLPAAEQLGYMKRFLNKAKWWRLIPTFGSSLDFSKHGLVKYVMARDGENTAVLYFLNQTTDTGCVNRLADSDYLVTWMNPRTGETERSEVCHTANGSLLLEDKPDGYDWVVLLERMK